MPNQNFLSPEFGTKLQREVPLFSKIPEFPFNTVEGSSHAKTSSIRLAVSIELRLVTDSNRQTDTRPQLVPVLAH